MNNWALAIWQVAIPKKFVFALALLNARTQYTESKSLVWSPDTSDALD